MELFIYPKQMQQSEKKAHLPKAHFENFFFDSKKNFFQNPDFYFFFQLNP